jgi:hypothetical protein
MCQKWIPAAASWSCWHIKASSRIPMERAWRGDKGSASVQPSPGERRERFVLLPAAFEFVQEPVTASHERKQRILEDHKRLLGPRGILSTTLQPLNSLTLSPGALDALPNVLVDCRELLKKEGAVGPINCWRSVFNSKLRPTRPTGH